MRGETIFGVIGGLVLAITLVLVLNWVASVPPMPCDADEVYVWVHHDDEARCVPSTDHSSHQGG